MASTDLPVPSAVFGSDVAAAAARITMEPPPLHVSEWTHVAVACSGRKREFATGRALARALLRQLGLPHGPLPAGAGGAPVWPPGIVGSISHAAGFCVVAVARARRTVGLGLDLEPAQKIEPQLARHILTPRELAWLAHDPDPLLSARIVFSAKESAYKSLYPLGGVFLDYQDVEIRLDRAHGTFAVASAPVVGDLRERGVEFRGRFSESGAWIVTGVTLVRATG